MDDNRDFGVMSGTSAENPFTPPAVLAGPVVLPAFPDMTVGRGGAGEAGPARVHAFFTTRRGGFSEGPYASLNLGFHTGDDARTVTRNWETLLRARGLSGMTTRAEASPLRPPVMPRLCHGAALLDADNADAVAAHAGADAVFTRVRGRPIAVTTADCLAALVVDPAAGVVAAVHAGWRGTRDNILGRTLTRLFSEGLCRPATTFVALGPCLSPAALEIGADIAATLPGAHVVAIGGRFHFDLRGCNHAQAVATGVPGAHISFVGGCTREDPDLYFSYRRDRGVTGRMAACIVLV